MLSFNNADIELKIKIFCWTQIIMSYFENSVDQIRMTSWAIGEYMIGLRV